MSRTSGLVGVLAVAVGCGEVRSVIDAGSDAAVDAAVDAAPGCDPTERFGAPVAIPELEMQGFTQFTPQLSPDELTIYFSARAINGSSDLYQARRASRNQLFGQPMLIDGPNSSANDDNPSLSADARTVWFESNRVPNQGNHLYVATRGSPSQPFTDIALADVNGSDPLQQDTQPFLTADGKELWFSSTRADGAGSFDLWHAAAVSGGFGTPVFAQELSTTSPDFLPMLSADRLTIYFVSNRGGPGTKGERDIFVAHRSTPDGTFDPAVPVDELNTTGNDHATWLSADNCRLYGWSQGVGFFVATRAAH